MATRLVAGLLAAALIACGDDEPTRPAVLAPCTGPLAVTVSAGLTPTFTWTPACRIDLLEVETASEGIPMWTVMAGIDLRSISPGVRYGAVPRGALEIAPGGGVPALEAGTRYAVALTAFGFPFGPEREFRQEFTP